MARLLVHVEGQTEESFVNEVLRQHLFQAGYHDVSARRLGNTRQRGGIRNWDSASKDILRHLKQDPFVVTTTMVDFFRLPGTWPGRLDATRIAGSAAKAQFVEQAVSAEIVRSMGSDFVPNRFVPFVMMHEFEALLFSDCSAFSKGMGQTALAGALHQIRCQFESPEDINDAPETAPSKRVLVLYPGHQKALMGVRCAQAIGLQTIRKECPHFDRWLNRLESQAGS